jgi:putative phosphoesterase
MHIGILSDIHDHLANLATAIGFFNERRADALICCGDLCSPFVVDELKKFTGPVHIVFGNNDADLFRITRKCDQRVQAHGELLEVEFGGRRIAVNHFDNIARPLAQSGLYDLVCFGNNHRMSLARIGETLAVNPGPIMGVALTSSGWERVPPTFAIYESAERKVEAWQIAANNQVQPIHFPTSETRGD